MNTNKDLYSNDTFTTLEEILASLIVIAEELNITLPKREEEVKED